MTDNDTGYWIIRLLLQRGLGFIYLMDFLVALNQFRPLCGDRGLLPATPFINFIPFREAPASSISFEATAPTSSSRSSASSCHF